MIKNYRLLGAALAVLLAGCTAPRTGGVLPTPRPLGSDIPALGNSLDGTHEAGRVEPTQPEGALKLGDALALALAHNPELKAFSYEIRAAEARILQAGLLPNPELEIEVEEYDRDGEGFDSSEMAIVLGQAIELGGKRRWRKRVAEAEGQLAGWEFEARRLDVFAETTERFIEVLGAQERAKLASTTVELAEKTAQAVRERVRAGKEPPLQATKADADLEMTHLTALEAERELAIARKRLAACWGSTKATFQAAHGELDRTLESLPDLDRVRDRLPDNPDLAKWGTELALRKANLAAEKAGRVPDVELSVGLQSFEEDGTDALVLGLGVALPLFDRNQGNIAAAGHELAGAKAAREAVRIQLVAELSARHTELILSHRKAVLLRDKIVPARTQAFRSAQEGYRQGKFGFLDVLDAQRSMFEARQDLVDALVEYHIALVAVQRMTGTSIEQLTSQKEE